MNREDLIQLAAETLRCEGQCAAGHYIYHDEPTGWWVVEDEDMVTLGRLLKTYLRPGNAMQVWCDTSDAVEVDLDCIVRDYEITLTTDVAALAAQCLAATPPDIVTALVLAFAADAVADTIRINAEIDRDHEGEGDR